MSGSLFKQHRVAIFNENSNFMDKIINVVRSFYPSHLKLKTYTDCNELLVDINYNRSTKHPFELIILDSEKMAEKRVIEYTNPDVRVLLSTKGTTLKGKLEKMML